MHHARLNAERNQLFCCMRTCHFQCNLPLTQPSPRDGATRLVQLAGRGMKGVGCWTLDVRCWTLDVQCWTLDVQCWMFDVGCSMSDVGCSPAHCHHRCHCCETSNIIVSRSGRL